jgi:uncharacterized membrane protein YkvA (DUF1232 family)
MSKVMKWIPNIKEPYTLYLVIRDPRTRRYSKVWAIAIVCLMIAYTFSPLDIIPDAIPVLGWMDDLVLIPVAFMFIEKVLPQDILVENRHIANRRVNRAILFTVLGILGFFTLWALIITAVVLLLIRLIHG